MPISAEDRERWLAHANPDPLPPEWIDAVIAKRNGLIVTENTREYIAVCEAAMAGKLVWHAVDVEPGSAKARWSVSYPNTVVAFSSKRRLKKPEQGALL